jgi:DNA-binding GntR family transcriptional regulator
MRPGGERFVRPLGQKGFVVAEISPGQFADLIATRHRLEEGMLGDAARLGDEGWKAAILAAFHRLSSRPSTMRRPDAPAGMVELHRPLVEAAIRHDVAGLVAAARPHGASVLDGAGVCLPSRREKSERAARVGRPCRSGRRGGEGRPPEAQRE